MFLCLWRSCVKSDHLVRTRNVYLCLRFFSFPFSIKFDRLTKQGKQGNRVHPHKMVSLYQNSTQRDVNFTFSILHYSPLLYD